MIMADLYSVFRANCQALVSGGDVAAANSWFLAFNAETALCWSFCAELIAQAHSRLEAEFPAENGTSNEVQMAASRYTHECFFAVKLLQNVVLVAEQWQQVEEEQRIQVRQMFVDILFQEAHPLYQAAFLRNQISCTLATLFAVSAMDTAISLSETDPLTEYQSVLDACQECISSCRHSLISVVETSKDTGVLMSVARVMLDIPAVTASLQRSKESYVQSIIPRHTLDKVLHCLLTGVSSVSSYGQVLMVCFNKVVTTFNEDVQQFNALTSYTSVNTIIEDMSTTCGLLHEVLNSLVVWMEASSSSISWLSAEDLFVPNFRDTDGTTMTSLLNILERVLYSICDHLLRLNNMYAVYSVDCSALVVLLQMCTGKIMEIFCHVLLSSSSEASSAVYQHFMSPESKCAQIQLHHCSGIFCIYRAVLAMADWIVLTGKEKYKLDLKLSVGVTLSNMKDHLSAEATSGQRNGAFVRLIQSSFHCSGLSLHSSDDDLIDADNDELNFVFVFMSQAVSELLEKHIDTIVLLDRSPLCPNSGIPHIRRMTDLVYFSLLLPHVYAKVTIIEALGTLVADCSSLHTSKYNEQKQYVLGMLLQSLFPCSAENNPDVVSLFNTLVLISTFSNENEDLEELASEKKEMHDSVSEVLRSLWRLVLSPTSPFVAETPQLISILYDYHIHPVCADIIDSLQEQSSHPNGSSTNSAITGQFLQQLHCWTRYLTLFAEETVEQFGLDEDEDEENDNNSQKTYGVSFTLYYRAWLKLLSELTEQFRAIRQLLSSSRFDGIFRSVLVEYCRLWDICPIILKAADPFMLSSADGSLCFTADAVRTINLGGANDVHEYLQLISGTWDLLHEALLLCSIDPALGPVRGRCDLTAVVKALQCIAEHCKCASTACSLQVLHRCREFMIREDELYKSMSYVVCPGAILYSASGGMRFYIMIATYLKRIGAGCDPVKDEVFQMVFHDILGPLELLFSQINQVCGVDKSSQQLVMLSDNLPYILNMYSRLKGLIHPLTEDGLFVTHIHKILDSLCSMFVTISELYVLTFSSTLDGRDESGVLHLMHIDDDITCPDIDSGQRNFSMLHDALVGILCTALDSPSCVAVAGNVFPLLCQITRSVQSAKLIQLVTILIRWGVQDKDSSVPPPGSVLYLAGQCVARFMYRIRLELDDVFAQVENHSGVCAPRSQYLGWFGQELTMIWKLSRQICSSCPLFLLHVTGESHDGDRHATVLTQFLSLCVSVIKLVGVPHATSCGLSLQLLPLVTVMEQLRSKAFISLSSVKSDTGKDDNAFVLSFVPAANEMLFMLLTHILYHEVSHKGAKQLFSQIYLILLDIFGVSLEERRVHPTQELLEALYWPFCSSLFYSQSCRAMNSKVMKVNQIDLASLPTFPDNIESEMENGVFMSDRNSGELQYVSAKTATVVVGELLHAREQRRNSSQQVRSTVKALDEIEKIFKLVSD